MTHSLTAAGRSATPSSPRPRAASRRLALLGTVAWLTTSGCYSHATLGGALATRGAARPAVALGGSAGLNGLRGGAGLRVDALASEDEWSGMLGFEAFRLWRGPESGVQPFVRGALGVFELGRSGGETFVGGLSPRAELGLAWFSRDYSALTLSASTEYRLRGDGLSTPVFGLALGFGSFDFFGSSPATTPEAGSRRRAGER